MRVSILAPIAWRCPPRDYGPWEQVASLLTEGLVAAGVDVTLFATLDSQTSAVLDGVVPHGYAQDPGMDGRVWEALHVAHAFARSGEFDLVHSHLDWLPLVFESACSVPLVTTVHGFGGRGILPAYRRSRSALVSISDSPNNGYGFFVQNGTFGNGHYCGKVRNTHTVVRNGVRRRVASKGTHRVCRVPAEIYATVSLTFSVTS